MPSLRRRRLVLIAVIVIAVGTLVAGLLTFFAAEEPSTVDATTSADPPVELSDEEPTAFKLAWARLLPERVEDQQLAFDRGYVAVMEDTGVRVYELTTGRERWRYLDSSRHVSRIAARHGHLLMVSTPADNADYHVQAFDLASGELRTTVPMPDGEERGVAPFADSFLVLSDGDPRDRRIGDPYRMYSYDGRELWTRQAEECADFAPSTQAYVADGGAVVVATYCLASDGVVTTHLVGVDLEEGGVAWRQDLENVRPRGQPMPPAPTWLVDGAPILLASPARDRVPPDTVVPVDATTGDPLTGGPLPRLAEELTPVRDGWCLFLADPAGQPRVHCYDTTTGAERQAPYLVPHDNSRTPTVRILPDGDDVAIASTSAVSLTVGTHGGRPIEITHSVHDPVGRYYGPGGLAVVSTLDSGDAELSVYSSAE